MQGYTPESIGTYIIALGNFFAVSEARESAAGAPPVPTESIIVLPGEKEVSDEPVNLCSENLALDQAEKQQRFIEKLFKRKSGKITDQQH